MKKRPSFVRIWEEKELWSQESFLSGYNIYLVRIKSRNWYLWLRNFTYKRVHLLALQQDFSWNRQSLLKISILKFISIALFSLFCFFFPKINSCFYSKMSSKTISLETFILAVYTYSSLFYFETESCLPRIVQPKLVPNWIFTASDLWVLELQH